MRECRLLILVLAGDSFVSNQNLNTQTKTWMKDIPQNVEVITYRGGKFDNFDEGRLFLQVSDEYSAISEKTKKAFEIYLNENTSVKKTFVVAGGVAANQGIKNTLKNLSNENNFECLFPDISLCSDNAAMIALVGIEKFKKKLFDELDFKVNPRWQLDEKAKFLKGAGVKI